MMQKGFCSSLGLYAIIMLIFLLIFAMYIETDMHLRLSISFANEVFFKCWIVIHLSGRIMQIQIH